MSPGYPPSAEPLARFELVREFALRALRKRRPWRVQGESMEPNFHDGDLVLLDPGGVIDVGSVVVARHPFKNLDVIKFVESVDDDAHLRLRSPGGDDSRQFGRVPLHTVRGVVTANVTARRLLVRP